MKFLRNPYKTVSSFGTCIAPRGGANGLLPTNSISQKKVLKALIQHNCLQPWTDKETLQKALGEHQTPANVAEAFGCSELTVRRWMDRHEIKKRAKLTENLLRELYVSQKLTTQEIAQDLHRTPVEIHFKLKEYGIEKRDGSHRFR